jgi:hypothetical protein
MAKYHYGINQNSKLTVDQKVRDLGWRSARKAKIYPSREVVE